MIRADPHVPTEIPYYAPFDFEGLLASYRVCAVGRLEWFTDGCMHRIFEHDGAVGEVAIRDDSARSRLIVTVDSSQPALIEFAVARVRTVFDADVDPVQIAATFAADPHLSRLLEQNPGLRLPTGWDPFEIAVATILGQFVGVDWARTLLGDLIELCGRPSGRERDGRAVNLFPRPADLARADLTKLRTTLARKATLKAFARAVLDHEISFDPAQDPEAFLKSARAIKGIGPWSAQYIAMRALRDADSFPASDLILARALEHHPPDVIERMRPWRGYAAALLWREYAQKLKKTNQRKARA